MNMPVVGSAYERSQTFSQKKLEELRAALAPIVPQETIGVAYGSYARREASSQSDIDYVLVVPDD